MDRSQSMKRNGEPIDRIGVVASTLCALHCALCALLPAILGALGLGVLLDQRAEWIFEVTSRDHAHSNSEIHESAGHHDDEVGAHLLGAAVRVSACLCLLFGHLLNLFGHLLNLHLSPRGRVEDGT